MNLWTILWLAVLVSVFIGTYVLNKRTPKPEGCEEMSECHGCQNVACSHYKEENENG